MLFVDHETRLSGGERDLVDLLHGIGKRIDAHVAIPAEGPLAIALRDAGATVHVVPMGERMRATSRWDLAGHPLLVLEVSGGVIAAAARLTRLARRIAPDVVHTNSMKSHLLSIPAARIARAPLVWHVRDILEPGWLRSAVDVCAAAAVDRVLCISQAVENGLDRRARAKAIVVYNGIRPAPADPEATRAWRARLGVSDGAPLVGIVGQIARWKGQDVFVEAASLLAARVPGSRFVIVGECLFPANEGAFADAVHRRADELGLEDRLTWTGPVDPVEPLMAALDVLVHASRLPEPFGRVIVEAMAQGTPVVTTNIGAGPELVPADAGRIVPPDDPDALTDAVATLLDDRQRLTDVGRRAEEAAGRFAIERTAAGVLDVYGRLR